MKTTLYNILSNKITDLSISKGIEIPMIQRDYVQGRSNSDSDEIRKQFLENIRESIEKKFNWRKKSSIRFYLRLC